MIPNYALQPRPLEFMTQFYNGRMLQPPPAVIPQSYRTKPVATVKVPVNMNGQADWAGSQYFGSVPLDFVYIGG